ncbi:MAG TPA: hypothetical protein PKY35_09420 [Candidatus Hydrogenedentes bacterium]|nr:hypothetical protein [Candidatus Hydrogenedentota bacterium]HOL77237.1 hypothetical protein [Candidatus Hydrogenedentota bacterium]HPO86526.1 hypothetical protein [Candidatus Hydrogenedentota bacterium]
MSAVPFSRFSLSLTLLSVSVLFPVTVCQAQTLDLSRAVILSNSPWEKVGKAMDLLVDEIAHRTGVRLPRVSAIPNDRTPAIFVDVLSHLTPDVKLPKDPEGMLNKPEGYAVWVEAESVPAIRVHVVGNDVRGALFGAGRLVRLLILRNHSVELQPDTCVVTAPRYPIRGHQLGYRDTANTYDAWDVSGYEQYIRDLVLFGTNSIELIPTLDPDEYQGRLMKRGMWEMNALLSKMIGDYGLDVWFWLPLEEDVTNPKEAQEALEVRRALFKACPHIAHVMVPGGDPGHTPPDILMPWLAKLAEVLHETHPGAGLWVSNQGFEKDQNEWFLNYLEQEKPTWLTGVVYGPWTKMSLEEQRKRIPKQFQQRWYPDITHTLRCQYPVPELDRAFGLTLSREPVCPRPFEMANIFNLEAKFTDGFVSYSDGSHDDFNKVVFSMLGWDPQTSPETIAKEYADAFFGDDFAEAGARGIIMLDRNWRGAINNNPLIEQTRTIWESIASLAASQFQDNWRMQMYVYRANYDSMLQHKATFEQKEEEKILHAVAKAKSDGGEAAAKAGIKAIDISRNTPFPDVVHARMYRLQELGLMLMKSIGYQLSVKPPFFALNPERSASLDFLNLPLNNILWLEKQFKEVLDMRDPAKQMKHVEEILAWEDAGPGGFYDDLGNLSKQPHLVRQTTWREDPGFIHGPQEEFSKALDNATLRFEDARLSWLDQSQTLYGTPLKMRYENLAADAQYKVRVTYAGRFKATMELWADGQYKVHDALLQPSPTWPVEFDVPKEATQDGVLELEWRLVAGRGCQVAEVWLLKK